MGPAFPALVALLIRMFGDSTMGIYAIKFTALLVLAIQLALFPLFSSALGMGELNGIIAACVWIAAKVSVTGLPNHQPTPMFGWESLYAALLLAIATFAFRRYLDSPPSRSTWLASWLGCVMGVSSLTSPSVAIVFVGFIGMLLGREKAFFQKSHLLLIVLAALVIALWLLRNFSVFHRFIFVRDNFGLELYVSNNDCAKFGTSSDFRANL